MVWSIGTRTWGFRRKVSENELMRPGVIYEFEHQIDRLPQGQEIAFLMYTKQKIESEQPYVKVDYAECGSHLLVQCRYVGPEITTLVEPTTIATIVAIIKAAAYFFAIAIMAYAVYQLITSLGSTEFGGMISGIITLFVVLYFFSFLTSVFRGFTEIMPRPAREEKK